MRRPCRPSRKAKGFIPAHVEAHAFLVETSEFYFAGPPPMIEAMNDLLILRRRASLVTS